MQFRFIIIETLNTKCLFVDEIIVPTDVESWRNKSENDKVADDQRGRRSIVGLELVRIVLLTK